MTSNGYNQKVELLTEDSGLGRHGMRLKQVLLVLVLFMAISAGFSSVHAAEYGFAPVTGQMTSPFGWRVDPITGSQRFHGGIDIAANQGIPVYAPQAGTVMFAGNYGGYGNVVVLNHGNSLYTLYGHNSQLMVQAGQVIQRGQLISLVGSTGRSTGPHLHFEVHYNQQYVNPLSYLSWLQQQNPNLMQDSQMGPQTAYAQPQTYAQRVAAHSVGTAASRTTISQARPHRVNRRRPGAHSVQLVNGTDVENIEF